MASKVFHVQLGVELDLRRDDLGHPEHAELWEQLYGHVTQGVLRCIGRHRGRCAPGCTEWMYLRVNPATSVRYAVHLNPGESAWAPESDEHKALKERIARAATAGGFEASIEDRAPHGRRRTDVLVHGNDVLLGCEPQLSPISVTTVRRRSAIAQADGITPLWTTTSLTASVIDRAPWARIDRKTWQQYLEPDDELPVRGGVRALTSIRCTPATVCNDRKLGRPCTGWNHQWEPRQLRRFDDLIVRAAATDLRAVKQEISRGRAYYFWTTADDLAQVDRPEGGAGVTVDLGPVAIRHPEDLVIDDREDDEECRYGEDTFHLPSRAKREAGTAIPAQRLARPAWPKAYLDWSAPEHMAATPQPCRLCGGMALLVDDLGRPCHKVCAEAE